MSGPATALREPVASADLRARLEENARVCTECGVCVKQCAFLQEHGTPKAVAEAYDASDPAHLGMPFECSLCGLCKAVCPEGVEPCELFLEMRREAVRRGAGDFPEHKGLLGYERRGRSKRYSYYALPAGCEEIFFPGCTFSGTRSDKVLQVLGLLQRENPRLGIVLDCCSKPSHDLGRDEDFRAAFGEMREYLAGRGVRRVLVACPNCFKVFQRYGEGLEVRTVYQVLAEATLPNERALSGSITVHDPCVVRFEDGVQASARRLLERTGLRVEEMKSAGRRTLCCGEGGAVGALSPDLAGAWKERRAAQAAGRRIATYCAGCAHQLSRHAPTSHVLDLVFEPEAAMAGRSSVARAPFTYWNRLRLKRRLRRAVDAAETRERTLPVGGNAPHLGWLKPLLLLAFLAAVVLAVRFTGATRYLEQETLRGWIQGYGLLAPFAYVLLFTAAPVLFLPGLPITVVGGILFGPLWGVVYATVGSNLGANLAFLISRYLARGWVEGQLVSPRWRRLDQQVADHGWKVVALTRFVPLFPFFLLNYAFGLTKIPWGQYAVATLVCMLPACVAFIVFSSSLLDLVRGRVSPQFLAGLGLIAAVSVIPLVYRKLGSAPTQASREAAAPCAHSVKRSLRTKALILAGLAASLYLGVGLIRRYFYAVDAYVYTWEFHYLFWVNNLRTPDLPKFAEYLASMGAFGQGGVMLCLAHLVQTFRVPLTEPLLAEAARRAYGLAAGGVAAYGSSLVAALASCAAGWLVLGDVLPLLRRDRPPLRTAAAFVPALALAVPWVPLVAAGALFGLLRPGARRTLVAVAAGTAVRVLWLLATPQLFLT